MELNASINKSNFVMTVFVFVQISKQIARFRPKKWFSIASEDQKLEFTSHSPFGIQSNKIVKVFTNIEIISRNRTITSNIKMSKTPSKVQEIKCSNPFKSHSKSQTFQSKYLKEVDDEILADAVENGIEVLRGANICRYCVKRIKNLKISDDTEPPRKKHTNVQSTPTKMDIHQSAASTSGSGYSLRSHQLPEFDISRA